MTSQAEAEVFEFPLSFAQQRLWLVDRLEGGSPFYNIAAAVRLDGALDREALVAALQSIVDRHEALRTRFVAGDGVAVQQVAADAILDVPLADAADDDDAVRILVDEEAGRPFDLARDLPVRVRLLRLGRRRHVLILVMHHIVADGWSMGVLVRELGALYRAFAAGLPSPLEELAIQYADWACWQREWLEGGEMDRQLAYWRERLTGAPPLLTLPLDHSRPPVQSHRGAVHAFTLDATTTAALNALARREGCSLFMVLLAAYAILLARLSGQDEVVVGSPIANRTRPEIEPLIGFFANTLALRCDLSDDPGFGDLLAACRRTALDAYDHQDLPFEQVVEALAPDRSLSYAPVFQAMLTLQNTAQEPLLLADLEVTPVAFARKTALFDLSLLVVETPLGLEAQFEYASDLFDPSTVARFADGWCVLLAAIADDPARPVSALPLLSPRERDHVLALGHGAPVPVVRPVHERFLAQAAATPDALAVVSGTARLTYREVDRQVRSLAAALKARNIGPGALVGVALERSADLPLAALGVLTAGNAYVPLDPTYPPERLALMTEVARPALVVTLSRHADLMPAGVPVLILDGDPLPEADDGPLPSVTPDQPAYGIFTSGSTGRPKLAGVAHRGMAVLHEHFIRAYGFDADDRALVITSPSFDLTQKCLFLPLITGGTVVLHPGDYDPRHIRATIAAEAVTWINCTPSGFYPLVEEPPTALDFLRLVVLGGEPIAPARFAPWRRSPGFHATVVNSYGPTECSDVVSTQAVAPGFPDGDVPIGRPVAGTRLVVLDKGGQPVPPGVVGDLHIGGACVGLGYLGDPVATAAAFRPDPFDGGMLYASGDRARMSADGVFSFLGRGDRQVKLRGYRVEPGEIEAALSAHPALRDAVVAVRTPAGEAILTAWMTVGAGTPPTDTALRAYLEERLPAYMVPGAFVVLDTLPLTPSGKVDRRALPDPAILTRDVVAPRTPVEQTIADIWADVLGQARIGVTDNFFALGGQSLLAIQAASRIAEAFGIELTMRALFEAPTVAELAERVTARRLDGVDGDELAAILAEVEAMSDDEAAHRIQD